jgi:hypothetical protein
VSRSRKGFFIGGDLLAMHEPGANWADQVRLRALAEDEDEEDVTLLPYSADTLQARLGH